MSKSLGKECENCQEFCYWDDLTDGLCETCFKDSEEPGRETEPDVWPFRGFDEDWGRPERQ